MKLLHTGLHSTLWSCLDVATAWSSPQLRLLNQNHALRSVVHRHLILSLILVDVSTCHMEVTDSVKDMCYLFRSLDHVAWALKLDNTHSAYPSTTTYLTNHKTTNTNGDIKNRHR